MSKGRRGRARSKRSPDQAIASLIGGGALLAIGPMLLGHSPLFLGLRALSPFGWLLIIIGAGLAWLRYSQRNSEATSLARPPTAPRPAERSQKKTASPRNSSPEFFAKDTPASKQFISDHTRPTNALPSSWSKDVFDLIEWRRFETVVEALFAQSGLDTKSQSHGADGGVDIWLHSKSQGGAPVSIVQCKHWSAKPVGVDKVRELRGVMAQHNISRGQFATTATFTPAALDFAKGNGINVLDVNGLLGLIATRTESQREDLLRIALEGDYWRPTCASCGIKLVEKSRKSGDKSFWGCANFPRCRTTMSMKPVRAN